MREGASGKENNIMKEMNELRKYIDGLVESGIPYIDVICHKDGLPVVREVAGKGVRGDEKLFIFSCTKPVTAALMMHLIEEGKLSLDDLVEKYIPEFRDVHLVVDGVEKSPKMKPTIYNLVTMTAGITYNLAGYPFKEAVANRGERSVTVAAMSAIPSVPLAREVGEQFEYSLCHDVLGAVIEVASGERLSSLMRRVIFEPLGMKKTYFGASREEGIFDSYRASDDGKISPCDSFNNYVLADGFESGGAGLVSTVEDYIKFADMLALGGVSREGVRVLSEESVRLMRIPAIKSVSVGGNYTSIQGKEYGYGLGVRTRMIASDWGLPVGEFGWDGAAGSYLMVDPERRVSVFVGMNVRNWPTVMRGKHLEIVKRIYEDLGL